MNCFILFFLKTINEKKKSLSLTLRVTSMSRYFFNDSMHKKEYINIKITFNTNL